MLAFFPELNILFLINFCINSFVGGPFMPVLG